MSAESRILRLDKVSHTRMLKLDPKRTAVAVAMSPLEVHGPHLPIGQDWFEAVSFLDRLVADVAEMRDDWTFLLVPPLPIATDCVPALGSVNYPVSLVRDVAYHTLLPFAKRGFARLAYSSFHGGPRHMCCLEDAADRLSRFKNVACASLFSVIANRLIEGSVFADAIRKAPGAKITEEQLMQDNHAGFVETSLALAFWPELVEPGWESLPPCVKGEEPLMKGERKSYYMAGEPVKDLAGRIERTVAGIRTMKDSIDHFKRNTYAGYPAMSNAEHGRWIFDHLANISKDIFIEFLDKGSDIPLHSPVWDIRGILMNPAVNYILDEQLKAFSE
jgi:creatinine amidohydrolase